MTNSKSSRQLPLVLDHGKLIAEAARRRRRSLLRFVKDSFPEYQAGWVHRDICERLERFSAAVAAKESPRMMMFIPPRHGKSLIASERFPAWHLGHHPRHQIAVTSYGQTLSDKFSKRARDVAASEMMRDTFPEFALHRDRQAVHEWETMAGGAYRAVGIGGGLTGTGADILLIDDPVKNAKEAQSKLIRDAHFDWYSTTAYTRLMPGGGILIIMTRWNEDDLAGRLLKSAAIGEGDEWEVIVYPAIAEQDETHRKKGEALHPDRYDLRKLERIRRAIKEGPFLALYQQRPSPPGGAIFKRHWWKKIPRASFPTRFNRKVQSWDCAFKGDVSSDFVVGLTVGKVGADYYILRRFREQVDFPGTVAAVQTEALAVPDARPVLVEDKANGPAVIATLKSKIAGLVARPSLGSKEARAQASTPPVEAGNVYLPSDEADEVWVHEFIEELAQFPRGGNDDQVDAFSQVIIYLEDDTCVFSDIGAMFGVETFDALDERLMACESIPGAVYIGVYIGSGRYDAVALAEDGSMFAWQGLEVATAREVLDGLRRFTRTVSLQKQAFVHFSSHALGATVNRLMDQEFTTPWDRAEAIESEKPPGRGELVTRLLDWFAETKAIRLAPWQRLYDEMGTFKSSVTENGTVLYAPAEGLSAGSVLALSLAVSCRTKFGGKTQDVNVIDAVSMFKRALED